MNRLGPSFVIVIKSLEIRMHITAKYFDNVYDLEVEPSDWLLSLKKKISVGFDANRVTGRR